MKERMLSHEGSFAFKELIEVLGNEFQGQFFIFEGFMFGLCTEGAIKVRINYNEYWVSENNLFIIPPKHIFSVLEYSSDFQAKLLFVSLDFIHRIPVIPDFDWLKNISSNPCVELDHEKVCDLINLYTMIERYDDSEELSEQIKNTLLLSLLLISASVFKNSVRIERSCSRAENITNCFFDLLLRHFETERSVAFYAGKLCVTPKYLSTAVKSVTRYSVQNWINDVVLFEAKRELRATDLTIQQISEKLHFPNASSFVRFFRTHIGETPLKYRKIKK